jgi:hypothetical protein
MSKSGNEWLKRGGLRDSDNTNISIYVTDESTHDTTAAYMIFNTSLTGKHTRDRAKGTLSDKVLIIIHVETLSLHVTYGSQSLALMSQTLMTTDMIATGFEYGTRCSDLGSSMWDKSPAKLLPSLSIFHPDFCVSLTMSHSNGTYPSLTTESAASLTLVSTRENMVLQTC